MEYRSKTRCIEEGRKDSFLLPHHTSPKPGQPSVERNDLSMGGLESEVSA